MIYKTIEASLFDIGATNMVHKKYLSLVAFIYLALAIITIFSLQVAPLSDDLSMIAFSKSWSWDWFNKGLADYFIVYPEYYGPQSNFIRPVSNIIYWTFSILFPTDDPFLANQMQLLIVNHGMLVAFALSMFFLIKSASASTFIAATGAVSGVLIPTFWTTPSPTYTSFVFDGLAVTFCLFALIAYSKNRLVVMTICLSLAILTKEITFPVLSGFGLAFLLLRDMRALIGCGIAAVIFAGIRLYGFGLHAEGVYVFNADGITFAQFAINKLRNVFTLPFGVVFYDEIFTSSGINVLNRSAILLVINAGIYVMIGSIIARLVIQTIREHGSIKKKFKSLFHRDRAIILIASNAALISFLSDVYVGANYRYAFNFLPFLFIAIAGASLSNFSRNAAFSIFLFGSMLGSGPALARLYNDFEFEKFRYQTMRDLFEVLRTHQDAQSIVILNDFVLGYANPKALELLLPTETRVHRGTSLYLDSCDINQFSTIVTRIERDNGETRTSVTLPECARFTFESSPKLGAFVSGNVIGRNAQIRYEFPFDHESSYLSVAGWTGRELTIITRDLDLVYFDFADKRWKIVRQN